jgi:predicted aspartyl protease
MATSFATAEIAPDIVIPFRFLSPEVLLIVVDAKINGQTLRDFIIDTGNGSFGIAVSKAAADRLELDVGPGGEGAFTVDLSQGFALATARTFRLGSLFRRKPEIGILPAIDDLNERLGTTIQGNIGHGFLMRYALTFDFQRSTLTLRRPEKSVAGFPFKLVTQSPLILVEVEANGIPLRLVLDTGASGCCLSTEAAERIGVEKGEEHALNGSSTMNGYMTQLASLKVGDREQRDVMVVAADFVSHLSEKGKTPIDGILGHNFWSKYRLTIDYPNRSLHLEDPQ